MAKTILTFSTALILFCILSANAAHANEINQVLFQSNFEKNGILDSNLISGNWIIDSNNSLEGFENEASKSGEISYGEQSWEDYQIITEIQPVLGTDYSVKFRKSNNSYYELKIHIASPIIKDSSESSLQLFRNDNGILSKLDKNSKISLTNDELYHLEIKLNDKKIRISLDEKDVFYIYDLESGLKKGGFSFNYDSGEYGLSILKIKKLAVIDLTPEKNKILTFTPPDGRL